MDLVPFLLGALMRVLWWQPGLEPAMVLCAAVIYSATVPTYNHCDRVAMRPQGQLANYIPSGELSHAKQFKALTHFKITAL